MEAPLKRGNTCQVMNTIMPITATITPMPPTLMTHVIRKSIHSVTGDTRNRAGVGLRSRLGAGEEGESEADGTLDSDISVKEGDVVSRRRVRRES
ncbi:hypothetical protein DB346_22240 [Verrucomicrobia bacterium LW23]|nr:hypothetical protein DB346_22240 [Verrucomicrobia bacterium LW23]